MKNMFRVFCIVFVAAVAIACNSQSQSVANSNAAREAAAPGRAVAEPTTVTDTHGDHASGPRVPAFQTDLASLKNLGATLAPEKFVGKTKAAYKAVREIPRTIAQLPCYCECDRGFGHTSLYSCYEDDHASHCAVCVDEALLAYRLEKEEKLKPEQIRERIIAQYSTQP
jgi:hypothetical protein